LGLESALVRNAFLALLFINLAYFAWAGWIDVPTAPAVTQAATRLPRLKLVSELPPSQAAPSGPRRTAYNEYSDTAPCMSVGPFVDILSSAQAAEILKAKGFEPRQRASVGEMLTQYWVSVTGTKSDAQALRVLKTLSDHGIRDAEAMPDDPNHVISVGLFTDREHAQRRADAVRQLGLVADISERQLPSAVYWVDLTPEVGRPAVPLQALFAAGVNTKIGVQPCAAPAQSGAAAGAAGSNAAVGTAASVGAGAAGSAAPPKVADAPRLQ
jgi:rhodanese-related sulfurtransferase